MTDSSGRVHPPAHGGEHGEGEHDHGNIPVPAVPGAGFVMIETQFVLRDFEGLLDRPAMPLDLDQGRDISVRRTPRGEAGHGPGAAVATDQEAMHPRFRSPPVMVGGVEMLQLHMGPDARPRAFPVPIRWRVNPGRRLRIARDRLG